MSEGDDEIRTLIREEDMVPVTFVPGRGWFVGKEWHDKAIAAARTEAWEAAREKEPRGTTPDGYPNYMEKYSDQSDWEKAREGK